MEKQEVVDTQGAYTKFLETYIQRLKSGEIEVTNVTLDNNEHVDLFDNSKRVTVSVLTVRSVKRS